VVFFGCVILFTTRPPKASVALQSAINPQPTPAPSIEKQLIYPWLSQRNMVKTTPLCERIAPPEGFERMSVASGSFAAWLRHLPTQPPDTPVTTSRRQVIIKPDDPRLAAVIALQPGSARILDANNMLLRLRAEYIWSTGQTAGMTFHFTSGHASTWDAWAAGARPIVQGRKVNFKQQAEPDNSRQSFCSYLETTFQYSSGYSILDDSRPADDLSVAAGDIFLNPSKRGYALMVLDVVHRVAAKDHDEVRVLLGRGGSPAQTFHVIRGSDGSPWFPITQSEGIRISAKELLRLKDLRHWR
jgi:hypothetical protein